MPKDIKSENNLENKISFRIIKVLHITAYIPLPIILIFVLLDWGRDYHFATNSYTWDMPGAMLGIFFTSLIYLIIVELIYKVIFYIIFGKIKH